MLESLRHCLHWAGDQTCTSAATQAAMVRFSIHCAVVGTPPQPYFTTPCIQAVSLSFHRASPCFLFESDLSGQRFSSRYLLAPAYGGPQHRPFVEGCCRCNCLTQVLSRLLLHLGQSPRWWGTSRLPELLSFQLPPRGAGPILLPFASFFFLLPYLVS